jgi:hypothetical protein
MGWRNLSRYIGFIQNPEGRTTGRYWISTFLDWLSAFLSLRFENPAWVGPLHTHFVFSRSSITNKVGRSSHGHMNIHKVHTSLWYNACMHKGTNEHADRTGQKVQISKRDGMGSMILIRVICRHHAVGISKDDG